MKHYVKPEIIFEDFSLTTNIAAACVQKHTLNEYVCPVEGTGGITFFTEHACDFEVISPDQVDQLKDNDGFCYHVPDGINMLFTSG